MFKELDDTIVAISSPPGIGVRGIIRLSGPAAFDLASAIFALDNDQEFSSLSGHRCVSGRVRVEGGTLPAEVYVFRAPASYTRQDVIELHTIGSPPVLASILDGLTEAGARPAEPGEFTARAYFSGALDLTRVEGVAAIIRARNDSQLRASEALLHGGLSKRSTALRERLADLLALIEAEIDFVEEPIDFISRDELVKNINEIAEDVRFLLRSSGEIERLEVLPEVLLVGRPNAGKSTLFNQLTGMDRAIRSATAGTTRDVIRAPLIVAGGEIMLADTAGLDANGNQETVARLAEEATRRAMTSADLVLLIIDVNDEPLETLARFHADILSRPVCVVVNKIDEIPPPARVNTFARAREDLLVFMLSALTGDGVDALKSELGRIFFSEAESHGGELLALSQRQRAVLREADQSLARARTICIETTRLSERIELIAIEIREAMNALSLLTGEVATEDLLGRIFSRFCIGK